MTGEQKRDESFSLSYFPNIYVYISVHVYNRNKLEVGQRQCLQVEQDTDTDIHELLCTENERARERTYSEQLHVEKNASNVKQKKKTKSLFWFSSLSFVVVVRRGRRLGQGSVQIEILSIFFEPIDGACFDVRSYALTLERFPTLNIGLEEMQRSSRENTTGHLRIRILPRRSS